MWVIPAIGSAIVVKVIIAYKYNSYGRASNRACGSGTKYYQRHFRKVI
jgi:hypothetical protein